jgi:cysteine desulfurase family protein (TIGR01976 family)
VNRDRFPGLAGSWVRLDGPAGTQMVDSAIEAMADFMRSGDNANHGGVFAAAHATDACVERARAAVARLLDAEPAGVAFGPSMTAMTMRLSAAVGRTLGPGDEVVVTRLDHDANVRPWVIAAERAGATVRWAEPDRGTLALPASAIEAVLSDRTRWVAVTAASNATGTAPALDAIVAAAHAAGARVSVDAVAAAPHRALSLRSLGADTLACSAYKWYGPHIGILCAAPALLEELGPDKLIVSPDEAPDRFELGTLPFESLAGVAAAADYLLDVGFDAVRAHEEALMADALEGLRAIDGVTLYGDPPDRVPTLMFNVDGMTSSAAATALAEREIAVWDGNYYAYELERFLGLDPDGAVRAGFVHYNDAEDVSRLVEAVAEIAHLKRGLTPFKSEGTPA